MVHPVLLPKNASVLNFLMEPHILKFPFTVAALVIVRDDNLLQTQTHCCKNYHIKCITLHKDISFSLLIH